ncbi:sugar ABC transporter substrate-binding protein [Longirhabdus pacifica]|uniref:sugar ABC transporter substrate-binding protein n=1 Tax=Longirhabdus pacifica TaxID=2305227 RepID=UPI001008F18D|nr:sugar ABC transporter substrate-binding protein [Longirhabdus pacifica]
MKKKVWSLALVCALSVSTLLAGCSSSGDEGSSSDTTTITVWAMGGEGKQLGQLTEKFEAENPEIEVEVQAIPWDTARDKILTAVASQNGPDVLQLGTTWVSEFADADALLDITPYLDDYPDFKAENYFSGSVETMKFNDKVVGIPWYIDTRVMYYRTDVLEEVGYSNAPATWDELKDATTKLTARGEDFYGLDIDQNDQINPFIFAWQNGYEFDADAEYMNFDSEAFVGAMEYYTSFFKEGIAPTTEGLEIVQAFKNGVKPIFFSGPWMINIINDQAPEIEGQWTTAVMPSQETNTSSIGGSVLSIFHNSENVEESLKFISYINEVDTQLEWLDIANTLPSRVAAWENSVLQEDPHLLAFGEQLANTKSSPQLAEFEAIAQELLSTLERVILGGEDLETQLEKFREKANEIVE